MSARRRPEGRLLFKPGAQTRTLGHSSGLYDAIHIRPRHTCCRRWLLCLDRLPYRREVDRAIDARILTVLEGRAVLAAADLIYECGDDIYGTFREALLLVAFQEFSACQGLAHEKSCWW